MGLSAGCGVAFMANECGIRACWRSRAWTGWASLPSSVQVPIDSARKLCLIPGVEEVGVTGELAARGELGASAPRDGVVDDERESGDCDRVRAWASSVRRVGHVADVVCAVEPRAVPAVGEAHVQAQSSAPRSRTARDRARALGARNSAAPERHARALRPSCIRVARDHLQSRRERVYRPRRPSRVGGDERERLDSASGDVQGRRPVGGRVGAIDAGRSPVVTERSRRREGVRRAVAEEGGVVRAPGLPRGDDRIVMISVPEPTSLGERDSGPWRRQPSLSDAVTDGIPVAVVPVVPPKLPATLL